MTRSPNEQVDRSYGTEPIYVHLSRRGHAENSWIKWTELNSVPCDVSTLSTSGVGQWLSPGSGGSSITTLGARSGPAAVGTPSASAQRSTVDHLDPDGSTGRSSVVSAPKRRAWSRRSPRRNPRVRLVLVDRGLALTEAGDLENFGSTYVEATTEADAALERGRVRCAHLRGVDTEAELVGLLHGVFYAHEQYAAEIRARARTVRGSDGQADHGAVVMTATSGAGYSRNTARGHSLP